MIEERPYVATTIEDSQGQVMGAYLSNGTLLQQAPTPTEEWSWDVVSARLVPFEVVWCGSKIKHDWSKTRGELLDDYSTLPRRRLREAGVRTGVKVATWAQEMSDDEEV